MSEGRGLTDKAFGLDHSLPLPVLSSSNYLWIYWRNQPVSGRRSTLSWYWI